MEQRNQQDKPKQLPTKLMAFAPPQQGLHRMEKLIDTAKLALQERDQLPFSVYSSVKEQRIVNVPIIKPLLICVLNGCKKLGSQQEIACPTGSFIFLSNSPNIDLRNISQGNEYFALIIEFDYSDFDCFSYQETNTETYFQGHIDSTLENTLQQFIEWSTFMPSDFWALRKKEILQVIYHLGYKQVSAIIEPPSLSHKLHNIISAHVSSDLSVEVLTEKLAMSESTLRRKLSAEGTSLQVIKDRVKLGHGLHLVQTSLDPIGRIAERCGYQSQSRFTEKFKHLFGITPTELRKTKVRD